METANEIFEKTLTSKHFFQSDDVEFSSLTTGSKVPAFNTIESNRPNFLTVSVIANFAVPSCVMSHWRKCSDEDDREDSSADVFRDNTTTFAE
jgi:hypothetical protein